MKTAEAKSIDSLFEKPARFILVTVFLLFLLLAGLVINANTGSVSIPAADVFRMIFQSLRYSLQNLLSGGKYIAELSAITEADTASQILFGSVSRGSFWLPCSAGHSPFPATCCRFSSAIPSQGLLSSAFLPERRWSSEQR